MHLIFRTALMLCTMLVFVAQALAADVRSYAVLPFKAVSYTHLTLPTT